MNLFEKNKFKYVNNMLSLDMVDYLSSWSLKNFKINNDPQAPMSSSIHSSESEIYFHILYFLKPLIELETGLNLKPMYSYNRIYMAGSELLKHKDRQKCEISASISLKYFYEDNDYTWPLYMGDTPINIKTGDGVIYKGCEVEHWRPVFAQPKNCWHHQLFIHYVDLNGKNKNLKEEIMNN